MWEMDNQIYGYMQKCNTDLECNFAILRYDTFATKSLWMVSDTILP